MQIVKTKNGHCDLSVLIPTIQDRKIMLLMLVNHLTNISKDYDVNIIYALDSREYSIGYKRNLLMSLADSDYVCYIDDDDWVSDDYFKLIFEGINQGVDCCSLIGIYSVNGKVDRKFVHDLIYDKYINGVYYLRPPNHLNCIKHSIVKNYKFKDINCGEDTDWAMRICNDRVLTTQHQISTPIYFYDYKTDKI